MAEEGTWARRLENVSKHPVQLLLTTDVNLNTFVTRNVVLARADSMAVRLMQIPEGGETSASQSPPRAPPTRSQEVYSSNATNSYRQRRLCGQATR